MDDQTRCPLQHIRIYPDNPLDLPLAHLQRAYGDSRPIPMALDGVHVTAATLAYRKTHRGLRPASPRDSTTSKLGVTSAHQISNAMQHAIAPFAQVLQQILGVTTPSIGQFPPRSANFRDGRALLAVADTDERARRDRMPLADQSRDSSRSLELEAPANEPTAAAPSDEPGLLLGSQAQTSDVDTLEKHIRDAALAAKARAPRGKGKKVGGKSTRSKKWPGCSPEGHPVSQGQCCHVETSSSASGAKRA